MNAATMLPRCIVPFSWLFGVLFCFVCCLNKRSTIGHINFSCVCYPQFSTGFSVFFPRCFGWHKIITKAEMPFNYAEFQIRIKWESSQSSRNDKNKNQSTRTHTRNPVTTKPYIFNMRASEWMNGDKMQHCMHKMLFK